MGDEADLEKDIEFEEERKRELLKISAVRTKFAATDLSTVKKNTFEESTSNSNRFDRNRPNSRNSRDQVSREQKPEVKNQK